MVQSIPSSLQSALTSDALPDPTERLTIHALNTAVPAANARASHDGMDVIAGLQKKPKSLPPKYFYDDHGSDLFEQICDLPEYYVTRTETSILQTCAVDIAQQTGPCDLIELGSGSSTKTRLLLDAYGQLPRTIAHPFRYLPVDVSGGMLTQSAQGLLAHYPTLHIQGLVGTYTQALRALPDAICPHRLVVFLGSSLGNLDSQACQQFMDNMCQALQPGDYFLLGLDLQKKRDVIEAAYNDAQGVTAAFNLNMLRHLNQRFGGNFDLAQFQHRAFYNTEHEQIEMHLQSGAAQTVTLAALDLEITLAPEETIRTEISRKFNLETLSQVLSGTDPQVGTLNPIQVWTDAHQWFALILCQYASS